LIGAFLFSSFLEVLMVKNISQRGNKK